MLCERQRGKGVRNSWLKGIFGVHKSLYTFKKGCQQTYMDFRFYPSSFATSPSPPPVLGFSGLDIREQDVLRGKCF